MKLFRLLLFLPLWLNAADMYVWNRNLDSLPVRQAVEKFHRLSNGKLLFLAGELENDHRSIHVRPAGFIDLNNATAVIRIHVKNLYSNPEILAEKIIELFQPWQKCKRLQIDLDCPEKDLDRYPVLMQTLRKKLPEVELSATALPCHLKHQKHFQTLADSCDYIVMQLHGLSEINGKQFIFSYAIARKAAADLKNFNGKFKAALPFYARNIKNGRLYPDLCRLQQLVKEFNNMPWIKGIIGFRLGVAGEMDSIDVANALAICDGANLSMEVAVHWQKQPNGAWYLFLENKGGFAEKITVKCVWDKNFRILDFDTFNRTNASDGIGSLTLTLPPDGEKMPFLWLRTTDDHDLKKNNPLKLIITRRESTEK